MATQPPSVDDRASPRFYPLRMSSNVGRNDRCPCGSGLKYKKCHLGRDRSLPAFDELAEAGAVIKHFPTEQAWVVGSPGISVYATVEIRGDQQAVADKPDEFVQFIEVEIPRYLPLTDAVFELPLNEATEATCEVLVVRKQRGTQEWSTLDTYDLPYFTRIRIAHETGLSEETVLRKVLAYLEEIGQLLDWRFEPFRDVRVSFVAYHTRRDDTSKPVLVKWFPLREPVHIPHPSRFTRVTEDIQLLMNKLKAEAAANANVSTSSWLDLGFKARVEWVLEEFRLYVRQHAQAVATLSEEQVRDLCLVVFKVVLSAEGEAFSFCGKTDIKVVNPDNKRDSALIEFKKWDGPASFRQAYKQLVDRYATGDERSLYLFFLSQRQDVNGVRTKVEELLHRQPETDLDESGVLVRIRDNDIPMRPYVADLHVPRT